MLPHEAITAIVIAQLALSTYSFINPFPFNAYFQKPLDTFEPVGYTFVPTQQKPQPAQPLYSIRGLAYRDAATAGWPSIFKTGRRKPPQPLEEKMSDPPKPPKPPGFDRKKAVSLAAFSFAVYGDPAAGRFFTTPDGAHLGFHTASLVRRNFHSLLLIQVLHANNLPAQRNIVEKALTGVNPYIILDLHGPSGKDTAVVRPIKTGRDAVFQQRLYLYVQDPERAELELTVKNKNIVKGDATIGHVRKPLRELLPAGPVLREWGNTLNISDPTIEKVTNGTVSLELFMVKMDPESEEATLAAAAEQALGKGDQGQGPQSLIEEIDWSGLATQIAGEPVNLGRFRLTCFVQHGPTSTEGAIWVDRHAKELVVSFRGTQPGEWKDFLIDLLIMQRPYTETEGETRWIHAGFKKAFHSIRQAVWTAIDFITPDLTGWSIDVTGHSLGGCLGCLMALDIADRHPQLAQEHRIQVYSFGSPRIGNTAFSRYYDERLRNSTFRLVNGFDIIARMPRTTTRPYYIEYDHCGKTVLLTTEAPGQVSVYEEDIHGPCPLRKVDEIKPLLRDSETSEEAKRAEKLLAGRPPRDRVAGISAQRMKTADKAARAEGRDEREQLSQILNIPSFSELEGNTTAAVDKLEEKREGKETMRSRARRWVGKKLNVTAAVEKVGLDFDFFEGEVTMLRDLLKGRGVLHHTEAYYYDWITHAFSAAAEKVEEEVGKVGEAVDQGGEPDVEGLKDGMQDAEDQVEAFKETVDEIPAAHYDTAGEEEGGDR